MAATDRAERLTNLLALLSEARAPLTAEQIFGELGSQYPDGQSARRQAFERDKATLRDLGVPIETEVLGGSDAGRTVYSIDRARYELQALDLDPDETRALQLAVAAIRSDTGFGTDAMIKLGAGSADVEVAVSASVPALAALPSLQAAIAARHPVTFEYRDRSRRIDPYGLLLRSGFWYLVGFDHSHDEARTFRVDRIAGAVAVDEEGTFERPSIDVAGFFPADAKQLALGGDDDADATAVVRLHGVRAAGLERELGAHRLLRHDEGTTDVEVPAANADAFRSWVLGFLDRAEVLSPDERRNEVVAWLDELVGRHGEAIGDHPAIDTAVESLREALSRRRQAAAGSGTAEARVRRMLLMLPWLTERGEAGLAEVAERFDLTPDEVEADITWMSMCGLPPYVDEMIDVYVDEGTVHVGVPRLFTRPLRLTAPEGFALLTAGRAAMALPGADPEEALGRGLAKLAAALGDDEHGVTLDLGRPPEADDLADAVRQVERLELEYWSPARDAVTSRAVTPRRLFSDRGFWYLRADDDRSGESRTFRLDRIERYTRLGEFREADDRGEDTEADSTWFSDADIRRVTLLLDPPAYWVTERYPVDGIDDITVDETPKRLVRLPVSSERWVQRLLVRLGPNAAVVEPEDWRDLAADTAAQILGRYQH